MKKNLFKFIYLFLAAIIVLQGCRKESFPGDDLGDNGTTFLKTPDGGFVVHWFSPFATKEKVSLFNLFKDAHNSTQLNANNTVKLLVNPSIITAYNKEHGTDLAALPANYFTWLQNDVVTVSGNDATVNFGNGALYGDFAIELDGSKWNNLAQKYALAFEIKDLGNIAPASSLSDTIIVQLGLKNQWDGIYSVEAGSVQRYSSPGVPTSGDALNGSLAGNPDVTLTSIDDNTVEVTNMRWAGGTSGIAGIDNLRFRINPTTNQVTVFSLGNPSAINVPGLENSYNPETQTFTINFHWNPTANKREILGLVLTYKEAR